MSDTAMPQQASYLTPAAYERLKAELESLSGEGRAQIAKRIEAAREEGDLRENGGYHAAKDEQGKMEARIRQLRALLETAVVGETPPPDDGVVEPGMVVTVDMFGDSVTFLLGSREMMADDLEVYSEKSPLGAAIMSKRVGDEVTYTAPSGTNVKVRITDTKPFLG